MRGRSIRISITILFLLGIAIAALGFKNINIDLPLFPALERGGSGPLGLKLGLDLRGGGSLVYQADVGTRFDVTLADRSTVVEAALHDAIQSVGYEEGDYDISSLALNFFRIETALLAEDDPRRAGLEEALQEGIGPILAIQTTDTEPPDERTRFDVTFFDTSFIIQDAIISTLQGLGYTEDEYDFIPRGANSFQIKTTLLEASDPKRAGLEAALRAGVGEIESFETTDVDPPTKDQMEGVLANINRRVNRFGTEEPKIQLFGDDRIIVQLPGASGSVTDIQFSEALPDASQMETLVDILDRTGYEDFEVTRRSDSSFRVTSNTVNKDKIAAATSAIEGGLGNLSVFNVTSGIDEAKRLIGLTARLEFKERTCEGGVDQINGFCIAPSDADIGLTGDDLSRADVSTDSAGINWVVNLQFNGRGTKIFSDLTERIVGNEAKRIAMFMDDVELIAPVSRAWIRDGRTQISGNFSREEARLLAIQLDSGRLPVPLKLIQEEEVDALLGAESLRNSLIAALVGLGLVIIFMVVYYRMAGVVAAIALTFYAIMVMAIFKMIPVTLELAHIGGFILSIGMAVDANILIFERMKEEVRIGRTLASSMEVGFNRAWPAIRDGNVSTLITCLVLLWFGDRLVSGLVSGVAISLGIGVMVSMFTALVVSRNLLQLMAWIGLGHRIQLFTPEKVQRPTQAAGGGR